MGLGYIEGGVLSRTRPKLLRQSATAARFSGGPVASRITLRRRHRRGWESESRTGPAERDDPCQNQEDRTPRLVALLYVAFVAWSLYGAVVPVETYLFRMVHMAFIYALSFLVYPVSKDAKPWTRWMDVSLAILGVACIAYAFIDLDQFIRRSTVPEPADFWLGIVAIVLLVEISRRVGGGRVHAGAGRIPAVRLLRSIHPRPAVPQGLRPGPDRRPLVHDPGGNLRRAALRQRLLRDTVRGLRHPHGRGRGRELLAGDVAGRDGARPRQRRPRRRHHHGAPGRPAGKRRGDHHVGVADHVADPEAGRLLPEHGRGAHLRRRHRGRPVAAPHGRRRVPHHAVPGSLLLGRGGDGHRAHAPLLRGHLLHGRVRGAQVQLRGSRGHREDAGRGDAHAGLPPDLADRPGHPARIWPVPGRLGHLGDPRQPSSPVS